MPEENWAAHGGVQACDLCHSRKVKCDRKEPCANCVASKADCLRDRHKRAPRPKVRTDDKIQALVERLSSLEDSVLIQQRSSRTESQETITPCPTLEDTAAYDRPPKRKRIEVTPNEGVPALTPDTSNTQQSAHEARSLISKELSTNGLLSTHQRSVLETAISFVDHLSQAPVPTVSDRSTFDRKMYAPTELSQAEILHVILGTEVKSVNAYSIHLHSLDHVPPRAVEKIALALMEGNADEKTLAMYKVIIHFKAAVVLYASQMQAPKSPAVQKHIRQMEYLHLTAALTALDNISFLATPSLLLVQVLITGAMILQIVGNPASCWEMISHASRTIVALGYHTMCKIEPKTELEEEILMAVAWCSQFDSCMSLLLLRPKSLPPLQIKMSSLIKPDPSNPMSLFEIIAMDIVPVHDKILELTLDTTRKKSTAVLQQEVTWLRKQMSDIYELMEKECPVHLLESVEDILLHWKCLEFKYFSTLTSVHRISPTVTTNSTEREECLQSARKALECLKVIETTGKSLGHFIEGYDPYLAWTMLSYPLCPFFVVFCNVVGTSNARDFQLLQDVTDGISTLITENKYVNRLHRLCATLLGLCKPLVRTLVARGDTHPPGQEETMPNVADVPTLSGSLGCCVSGMPIHGNTSDFMISSWNDDMMWQLFQSQPSLDWFNADILDPNLNFGNPK